MIDSKSKRGLIIVTHNDRFHADDVFAMATLQIFLGKGIKKVYRTRDQKIIDKADIVFDVGNIYDPKKNRFDHHQKESVGERENGIPFASFGLIWKHFGKKVCGSEQIAKEVDIRLVQPIDAGDNGFAITKNIILGVDQYFMDRMVGAFCPTWKEKGDYDKRFFEVVKIAKLIIEREIILAKHKVESIPILKKNYQKTIDKRLLILDKFLPWKDFIKDKKDILFVIYPSLNDSYFRINAVQEENFINRKDFPKEWAGLRDEELEKVSSIKGAKFCHRKLFLVVADTKEVAIKLAKLALNN